MNRYYSFFSIVLSLSLTLSCKSKWLDAKPDVTLVVPASIADYQAILDNSVQIFNNSQSSGMGEMAAGDFTITNTVYGSLFGQVEKSAYIWAPTAGFYGNEPSTDWNNGYKRILNANVILDGIDKIKPSEAEIAEWNNVKGSALFFRSFDFFCLAEQFCKPYSPGISNNDLGLPLRINHNVNLQVGRSTLQQTYDQLITDLKASIPLLGTQPLVKTRPSRQAAYAMLARVYLSIEQYNEAKLYADSALHIQSELIDFSTLNAAANYPMTKFNPEVIFHSFFSYGIFNSMRPITAPDLYNSFSENDYRKTVFYRTVAGGATFKGSYVGDRQLFGGLATDELYLVRAESNARLGNLPSALDDVNHLLRTRWKGTYTNITGNDQLTILRLILKERRKELAFRGIRWSDLRRLNRDDRFAITLNRTINDINYELPPNDKRYVFPIDEMEITRNGIQQNDR